MRVEELATVKEFEAIHIADKDRAVSTGYCGDLLSDVMANAPAQSVLMTIQAHKNTIAVASLVGISALVICNGRTVGADMLDAAREEEISIFVTDLNHFEAAAKVMALLERGDAGTH
ncbi:MAG: iron-sulfur binding hydrogenase [Sphaerochaeta sp.]|nr:iron-sulfur binding hydrogenase [Sphaerochaeta sp.]